MKIYYMILIIRVKNLDEYLRRVVKNVCVVIKLLNVSRKEKKKNRENGCSEINELLLRKVADYVASCSWSQG